MKRRRVRHKRYRAKVYAYAPRRRAISTARYRRFRRRGGSRGGGGYKSLIAPIIGGVADAVINPRSPIDGIGSTAVGFFMHNETIKNIGLYQVGTSIAQFIPFIGGGSGGIGGSQV